MGLLQYIGRRTKSVNTKDEIRSNNCERVAYNEGISRMRNSEYPMLKGIP
jgi:hypothetical protein